MCHDHSQDVPQEHEESGVKRLLGYTSLLKYGPPETSPWTSSIPNISPLTTTVMFITFVKHSSKRHDA